MYNAGVGLCMSGLWVYVRRALSSLFSYLHTSISSSLWEKRDWFQNEVSPQRLYFWIKRTAVIQMEVDKTMIKLWWPEDIFCHPLRVKVSLKDRYTVVVERRFASVFSHILKHIWRGTFKGKETAKIKNHKYKNRNISKKKTKTNLDCLLSIYLWK